MKTNRPKIEVPLEPIDILVDILSVTILMIMLVYIGVSYNELPEVIPSHFNAHGKADGFSNKIMIWLVPIIAFVLFVGMYILNKYPHYHNFMVNITKENALKNYRFSTRIVRFTSLFVMITFAFVSYTMVEASKGKSLDIGPWALPIIVVFTILLPIIILYYQNKINKT